MWKEIGVLKEPFNDAVNYKSKNQKEFFSTIFLRTNQLKECLEPSTYYLMGEKGTGKTAYAVYLENNSINDTKCKLTTMTETQYKRFIELKNKGRLEYSDYANIWRSILLLIASQMLIEKSKLFYHSFTGKFNKIEAAIARWNKNALNPEVESAFEAIDSDILSVKANAEKIMEMKAEESHKESEKVTRIKHHLLETEMALKEAICDLKKIKNNHVLFIDGIDYRPEGVKYNDYIECIKGLSEAAWQLNTEFFNNIKDSPGLIKIVLLVRPDVFHKLNLYNSNSRLQDNCVYLDWTTTEKDFELSSLYDMSGRYFSSQQAKRKPPKDNESAINLNKEALTHYFNGENETNKLFKTLLRNSFQKPRDFLTFFKIAINFNIKQGKSNQTQFEKDIYFQPNVSKQFSDYMLGEVKNYASFYMSPIDFSNYLKFFQFLNGKSKFTISECQTAFDNFKNWALGESFVVKDYMKDIYSLLQFFYETNVIGYHETAVRDGSDFYHWAYKERSLNNLSPKIKTDCTLILNPGISKALDIGKELRSPNQVSPLPRRSKPHSNKPRRTRIRRIKP